MNESRLRALLAAPELEWILARARRRMEQGAAPSGTIQLRDPTDAQRAAFERLFGRRTRGGALTASLDELARALREAGVCDSLEEAVIALTGPVRDLRAESAAAKAAWEGLFAGAMASQAARPEVIAWLGDLRSTGLLRRLSGGDPRAARELLRQALEAARRLPARGIPLPELAAAIAGDSHALDPGTPLGAIVLRLAAAVGGAPRWDRAAERRDAWESAGVLVDDLSAPVLVLNVAADLDTLAGRVLSMHAEAGEPCRVSARQMRRAPPRPRAREVFVCENPAVLAAAADRLGARSAPLLCVEGQPRTAARLLLEALRGSGAALHYHGDFDWAGLRIASLVLGQHGAVPWRFGAGDYMAAPKGPPLLGSPSEAPWDPDLAAAMREDGRAVHEEGVLEGLLADLSR